MNRHLAKRVLGSIHSLVFCEIYVTTKTVLKKPDFAATFFIERVEASMRAGIVQVKL